MNHPQRSDARLRIDAAAIVDGGDIAAAPGVLLLDERGRIVAAGRPEEIGATPDVKRLDHRKSVIIPALVNTHTHLDLTHIGPQPFSGEFSDWLRFVQAERTHDEALLTASVRAGVACSLRGGTALVGDIVGNASPVAVASLAASGLAAVAFMEVFGIGDRETHGQERIRTLMHDLPPRLGSARIGIQPHAPYSCARSIYEAAAATGRPMATHLAESLDEIAFTKGGTGLFIDMLRKLGVGGTGLGRWGVHPVDHLAPVLSRSRCLVAHLNYLDEAHLDMICNWPISVAYCPRASVYFGHPVPSHPQHSYQAMLDRGMCVALGTDSIICLDTPDRISVLDEMRLLSRRDGVDPRILLRMGTVHGAMALGVDPAWFTLQPGPVAGLLSLSIGGDVGTEATVDDFLAAVMMDDSAPAWVTPPERAAGCLDGVCKP